MGVAARPAAVAALAVLTAVLAGCTPDPTPRPDAHAETWGSLEELLELAQHDLHGTAQRLAEGEQAIAACMAEKGFEYYPVQYVMSRDMGLA